MIAQLIPVDGSPPISIKRDLTLVGRKRGLCDFIIDHGSISKIHCIIAKTDGLLFIRDLGSTNGTKVNGQRIMRGALLPGDELSFAGIRYRVHLGPGTPSVSHEMTEELRQFAPQRHEDPQDPEADEPEPEIGVLDSNGELCLSGEH